MKIADIITSLNAKIESSLCNIPHKICGIAEPVVRREEADGEGGDVWFPAIVSSDGESIYPFVDDDYDVGLYHRLLGKTYQYEQRGNIGDGKKQVCTSEIALICWGFRSAISAEEMEQYIFSKTGKSVEFVSSDFDRKRVFASEFQDIPFFLPEDVFLFSIKYKTKTIVNPDCIEINEIFNC